MRCVHIRIKYDLVLMNTPGELGVSNYVEFDTFPLQCFDSVALAIGRVSSL